MEVYMSSFKSRKSHHLKNRRKMPAAATIRPNTTPMPKNKASRWVAVDFDDKIIAEGINPDEVRKEALKVTDKFMIAFVPISGATYVL